MDKLYLERLYSHYKAGNVNDSGNLSHVLQIAKSMGGGLSKEQFTNLAGVVHRMQSKHESGEITSAQFQDRLWALPKVFGSAMKSPINKVNKDTRVPDRSDAASVVTSAASASSDVMHFGDITPGSPPVHHSGPPPIQGDSLSKMSRGADAVQMGLDAWGVFGDAVVPGTGVAADGINALLSLGRVFTDPGRAGTHLFNAGVSAVSMIPFVGDFAKVAKYGVKGTKAMKGARGIAKAGVHAEEIAAKRAAINAKFDEKIARHKAGAEAGNSPLSNDYLKSLEHVRNMELEKLDRQPGLFEKVGGAMGGIFGGGGSSGGGGGNDDGAKPASSSGSGGGGRGSGLLNWLIWGDSDGGSSSGGPSKSLGLGKTVDTLAEKFKKLMEWLDKVDKKNRILLDSFDNLAQVNGQIANSYGRLELGRFNRAIEKGRFMDDSVSSLANSQNRNEEARQNLTKSYERTGTNLQTLRTQSSAFIMEALHKLDYISSTLDVINTLLERYLPKGEDAGDRLSQAMNRESEKLRTQHKL